MNRFRRKYSQKMPPSCTWNCDKDPGLSTSFVQQFGPGVRAVSTTSICFATSFEMCSIQCTRFHPGKKNGMASFALKDAVPVRRKFNFPRLQDMKSRSDIRPYTNLWAPFGGIDHRYIVSCPQRRHRNPLQSRSSSSEEQPWVRLPC